MGKRSNFQRRPMDSYATPLAAVRPIVPFLKAEGIYRFAEPCCGNGDLIQHLEFFGFECVHASDINQGVDALSLNSFANADAIITNTPWARELLHLLIEHFMRKLPTYLLFDAIGLTRGNPRSSSDIVRQSCRSAACAGFRIHRSPARTTPPGTALTLGT